MMQFTYLLIFLFFSLSSLVFWVYIYFFDFSCLDLIVDPVYSVNIYYTKAVTSENDLFVTNV